MTWSTPHRYDLTRSQRRTTIPSSFTQSVPECPETCVIFHVGPGSAGELILNIGECGPRSASTPRGLRGRLASGAAHSSSERIAHDLVSGLLRGPLLVCGQNARQRGRQEAAGRVTRSLCARIRPAPKVQHEGGALLGLRPVHAVVRIVKGCDLPSRNFLVKRPTLNRGLTAVAADGGQCDDEPPRLKRRR
jgi:hypothetical protein